MKKLTLMFLAFLFTGCGQVEKDYPTISGIFHSYTVDKPDPPGNTYPVSMMRLISEPDKYDGRLVSADGVLSCKDKRVLLFMNEFSYRSFNITEFVAMPSMPEEIQKKCADYAEGEAVTVFGLFRKPREDVDDESIGRFEWVSHIGFSGFSVARNW